MIKAAVGELVFTTLAAFATYWLLKWALPSFGFGTWYDIWWVATCAAVFWLFILRDL